MFVQSIGTKRTSALCFPVPAWFDIPWPLCETSHCCRPAPAGLKAESRIRESAVARAEVAELADAHGSGPCTRKSVGVRVPSSAPIVSKCLSSIRLPGIFVLYGFRLRVKGHDRNSTRQHLARRAHRKKVAQRLNRNTSPYQQRTNPRENPAQQPIKQAVDFLIQQLKQGKSEILTAYLAAMG